ncbi:MAG: phosphatidate cytidylyltransferase, partial [Actinobacteria bacterium]|nr:phosphatidate cytidylyltransferase [Actinomycetota bacterium]
LTEEELPPLEAEAEGGREAENLKEVDLDEYAVSTPDEGEPETIYIEDESVAGIGDSEAAAAHFAGDVESVEAVGTEDIEESILGDLGVEDDAPVAVQVGATEALQGPSWQEPTSEDVGSEAPAPAGGRDLPAAILTGIGLAAVAILSLWAGRVWFALVAGLVLVAAQAEFYGVLTRRHHQPATALGLGSGVLILSGAYIHGVPAAGAMFALSVVFTFIWYMTTPRHHRTNALVDIALTLFGIAWIPLMGSSLLVVLKYEPSGRALVVGILAMVISYDVVAFAVGSMWGDRPLAPTISPRKSQEGAIAASIVVVAIALAGLASIDGVSIGGALLLGLAVAALAPLGDLAESLIKRDLGIKDMSSVLPGHGGLLDRIDSGLLVAPAMLVILGMVLQA